MSPYEKRMLDYLNKKPVTCDRCEHWNSATCGRMVPVHVTSSGMTYKKEPDDRCRKGEG